MSEDILKPQTTVGQYAIKRVLGRGAFGITYLASHLREQTTVAIKEFFPADFAVRSEDGSTVNTSEATGDASIDYQSGLDKFLEESRILSSFNSPHIVRVVDTFELNATAYMVMQYEEGGELSRYLDAHHQPLTEDQLRSIFIPVLRGLKDIHARWLLHRDIKPENIYIRKDGSPLLIDFGTARHALSVKQGGMTEYLTPGFAPPEQYDRLDDHGPWTDIYAVGATMYYCVTRIKPAEGRRRMGKTDPVMPLAQAAPAMYDRELLEIIDWMMIPDLKKRPQSVDEVLDRFDGLQSNYSNAALSDSPSIQQTVRRTESNDSLETLERSSTEDKNIEQPRSQPVTSKRSPEQPTKSNFKTLAVVSVLVVVITVAITADWSGVTGISPIEIADKSITTDEVQVAEAKAKEEADWVAAKKAKLEADKNAQEKADRVAAEKAKKEAEKKAQEEADRIAAEEAKLAAEQRAITETCEAHVEANRLTSGQGGNALDCYLELLALSPGNSVALEGLKQIGDTYERWAERDIERGNIETARRNIEKLKQLNSEDERIMELEDRILNLENQREKAKEEVAKQKAEADRVAAEKAKREAERKAKEEADRVAAEKAKWEAEKKAQEEADRVAAEKAKKEAEKKAQEEAVDLSHYGIDMVNITGGSFMMGSPKNEKDRDEDEKQHNVTVDDFRINRTEVTLQAFNQFVSATGYRTDAEKNAGGKEGCFSLNNDKWGYHKGRNFNSTGLSQTNRHPVVCVSHNDAMAYIKWLNMVTRKQFRLPTEAEWEYAARGGSAKSRFWSDKIDSKACQYANIADKGNNWVPYFPCNDGYEYIAPVGKFQSNPYGLKDMLGNVWEWTCSKWSSNYNGSEKRCSSSADRFSLRGGSGSTGPAVVRVANRSEYHATVRSYGVGFRLLQVN